jgi:hypothetical protein
MSDKVSIPKSLKNAVWISHCGEVFRHKCIVSWCTNIMTAFDFETGHNIPESKGGLTTLSNLRPICGICNKSMGNRYTIDEYSQRFGKSDPAMVDPVKHTIAKNIFSSFICSKHCGSIQS